MSNRRVVRVFLGVVFLHMIWCGITWAADPVVVTMMQFNRKEEIDWQQAVIDQFHSEQSKIRIELIQTSGGTPVAKAFAMAVAGQPPHIGYADPYETIRWGLEGLTINLEPYFIKDAKKAPFKDFLLPALEMHTAAGKRFAIPYDLQVEAFMYAEQPFLDAGLPFPTASWTWDTVTKTAPKLVRDDNNDSKPERWAMMYPQWYHWWPLLWHHGAEFVDDAKLPTRFTGDSPAMRTALEWMYTMINEKNVMPKRGVLKGSTGLNLVTSQSIAMAIGSSLYQQEAVQIASQVPWNVSPLPKGPAGNVALTNALGFAMFAGTENQDAAWEVIRYFCSEKSMRMAVEIRGTLVPHLPVDIQVWTRKWDAPKNKQAFIDALQTARPLPIIHGTGIAAIDTNTQAYWAGSMPITQALANIKTGLESWMASLRR